MTQYERIEKMLSELKKDGARFNLSRNGRAYLLIYKDKPLSNSEYVIGLNKIERFLNDKCCELDSRTGIIY